MMLSMLSLMTVVSIFFGGFGLAPGTLMGVPCGELKFRVETALEEPLSEELVKAFAGMPLDKLSAEFDIKYKTNEDAKKVEMQWDMVLSNSVDEPLGVSCWINTDFSDRNVPKVLIILKSDYDYKYNVVDMQYPSIHSGMNAMGGFAGLLDGSMINAISENVSKSLNESGFGLTENDGQFSAVMSEVLLKEVIRQIALGVGEYFGTGVSYINSSSSEEIQTQIREDINEFFAAFSDVQVFEEDALVFNMTTDENSRPSNINYAVNINTNIYDLMNALKWPINEGLTPQNTKIDMNVTFDYNYRTVGEDIVIDYPELTGENSIDMMPGYFLPDIDVNTVNMVLENKLITAANKPFIENGIVYTPLREVLNLKGVENENIIWDNGIIKIKTPDFSASLAIGSSEIDREGETVDLGADVLLVNDTTYIPASALGELGLGAVTNTFFDEENNIIGCVVYIYKYSARQLGLIRFLIPNAEWEKNLYMAGDMAGAKIDVVFTSEETYIEHTNLVIAAGDPMVIIGKYSDEFLSQMAEMDAIYPALDMGDGYSVIIPKVVSNVNAAMEVVKIFISLLDSE